MMGAPESYEKNQNSYRARTRESAARRLYISDHRPNEEAVPCTNTTGMRPRRCGTDA